MELSNRRIEQLIIECSEYGNIKKIKPKRGMIDEVEFFLAYVKLIEERFKKTKSKESDLEKAQIRLRIAQAQKAELDFERENQSLVSKDISIRFIANTFGNVRNKLLGSPNRIAFQVFGAKTLPEAKVKVRKIINEILSELSNPETLFKNNDKLNK